MWWLRWVRCILLVRPDTRSNVASCVFVLESCLYVLYFLLCVVCRGVCRYHRDHCAQCARVRGLAVRLATHADELSAVRPRSAHRSVRAYHLLCVRAAFVYGLRVCM